MLERIVTVVDAAVASSGWYHPHVLVEVVARGRELDVALLELDGGASPVEALLGFVAPSHWAAIGVVTYGWAAPASDGVRPRAHGARRRVRVTAVVDRAGDAAVTATFEDGEVIDEPGEGRLDDVLRRCLGLPTAPPPPVRALADVLWVEAVLADAAEAAATGAAPPPWRRVAALRPDAGRVTTGWARLRSLAARDDAWGALADWMDDGMFARWVLASRPALADLLAECDLRLPAAVAARLRREVG